MIAAGGKRRSDTGRPPRGDRSPRPRRQAQLRLRRDGKTQTVTVKTVASPDDAGTRVIGMRVAQDAKIKLPVKVDIDLGDVGGPSAGLAVRARDPAGARKDGRPRSNGGGDRRDRARRQRQPGRRDQPEDSGCEALGADIFLVPAGENAATASRYAGDMRVVPVENFQQALRVLRTTRLKSDVCRQFVWRRTGVNCGLFVERPPCGGAAVRQESCPGRGARRDYREILSKQAEQPAMIAISVVRACAPSRRRWSCPTFRAATTGALEPPRQPRLVPLTTARPAAGFAA